MTAKAVYISLKQCLKKAAFERESSHWIQSSNSTFVSKKYLLDGVPSSEVSQRICPYLWVKPPLAELSSWTYSNLSKWRFHFIYIFFAWYHRQRLLIQQRWTTLGYFHIVPTYFVLLERTDLEKKFFHLASAIQDQSDNAGVFLLTHLLLPDATWSSSVSSYTKIYAEKYWTLCLCMTPGLPHNSLQLANVLQLRMKPIVKENQEHCMKFKTFEFFPTRFHFLLK